MYKVKNSKGLYLLVSTLQWIFQWHNSDTTSCYFVIPTMWLWEIGKIKSWLFLELWAVIFTSGTPLTAQLSFYFFPFGHSVLFECDVKLQNCEHIQAVVHVFMNNRYCNLLQKVFILVQLNQLSISLCFHTALVQTLLFCLKKSKIQQRQVPPLQTSCGCSAILSHCISPLLSHTELTNHRPIRMNREGFWVFVQQFVKLLDVKPLYFEGKNLT